MLKNLLKKLLLFVFICFFLSFCFNCYLWVKNRTSRKSFSSGFYSYNYAKLCASNKIYSCVKHSIKPNDKLFISMFLWPFYSSSNKIDEMLINLPHYDIYLADFLKKQQTNGNVFSDAISFSYEPTKERIINNPVIKASNNLHWHILTNPYSIPNNIIWWPISNPITHYFIHKIPGLTSRKIYLAGKISSNHQKIIIINDGESAWIGSKNFNQKNWANQDNFLFVSGNIAKILYYYTAKTISDLNPGFTNFTKIAKNSTHGLKEYKWSLSSKLPNKHIAKVLTSSEIKPTLVKLIQHSKTIYAQISLLTDNTIIKEFNKFILNGGKLYLILDPNNYLFTIKFQWVPNIIAMLDISEKAKIRIMDTKFQMHTKSILFTLKNGPKVFYCGTANITTGAISRFSYSDIALLVINDKNVNKEYMKDFYHNWKHSTKRKEMPIKNKYLRYYLAKLALLTGLNPW